MDVKWFIYFRRSEIVGRKSVVLGRFVRCWFIIIGRSVRDV